MSSAKMAQSGIGPISPWAAMSASVVDWTPAPSERTRRWGAFMLPLLRRSPGRTASIRPPK